MRTTTPAGIALVLMTAAVCAAAGCSSTTEGSGSTEAPTSTVSATDAEVQEAPASDGPEVGTWRTGSVPFAEFEKSIVRAGFEPYVDTFRKDVEGAETMSLALLLRDGFITLTHAADGGADQVTDRGTYERRGRRLVVTNGSGTNVLAFRVEDDQLRLRLVSTTEPRYAGAPAAMFQTAWYETTPFTRAAE